ncbi:hypothetical protein Tco_0617921 [Tanacetum coccineum]
MMKENLREHPRVNVLGYAGLPMQPRAHHHRITYQSQGSHNNTWQFLTTRIEQKPMFVQHNDPTMCQSICTSNPEEGSKGVQEDEETEDVRIDYPMDGGDDGDDDDGDSSRDDADDEDKDDEDEEGKRRST